MKARKLNGSQIVMEVLLEEGVDTIFGYPGGAVLNIYDALYHYQDKIKHIMPVDECGAGHAADGYARASGKVGVVLATSGPGATNLVTPLATAYMDSVPLVAITGNVPKALVGKDSFQEVYIAGITMPITKHNFVVRDVKDLAHTLRKAFYLANSGRKAPVLVDIPKDVSADVCEYIPQKLAVRENRTLDKTNLDKVLKLIKKAKKPLLYFGGGAKDSSKLILKFMKKFQIPCVHTSMAAGVLSCYEPLNLGLLGMHGSVSANTAVDEADLIIALGTRFSDRVALNGEAFAKKAKKIHIDIDKSELNKNVHIECSLLGDLNLILENLCKSCEKEKFDHKAWLKELKELKEKDFKENPHLCFYHRVSKFDKKAAIEPKALFQILSDKAGEDAIYTTDVGQHQMWALQYLAHQKPRSFLTSGGLGTMGFGYGAAIGAAFAKPKHNVFHISGDGSFLMNLNEITTAVEYNLPVISIVLNNNTLGMVRQWQTSFYSKRYSSTDICKKFDYVKVAQGFGANGFSCKTLGEFEKALEEALKNKKPTWIECIIDKDSKVLPMIPSGGSVANIIVK